MQIKSEWPEKSRCDKDCGIWKTKGILRAVDDAGICAGMLDAQQSGAWHGGISRSS